MAFKNKIQWIFLAVAFFAAATAQAEYDKWIGVIFSAERRVYDAENPAVVEKSNIYSSKVGTRIEHGEGQEKAISIVNYQKQKCWLIQPEKKVYYEVALDPETKQCKRLDLAGFRPETQNSGVFFPRPCFGFKSMKVLGEEYAMGRFIAKWQCLGDEGGATVQHWYDTTLRMVIREVRNNTVAEGSKIALSRAVQHSLLLPPPDYALETLH